VDVAAADVMFAPALDDAATVVVVATALLLIGVVVVTAAEVMSVPALDDAGIVVTAALVVVFVVAVAREALVAATDEFEASVVVAAPVVVAAADEFPGLVVAAAVVLEFVAGTVTNVVEFETDVIVVVGAAAALEEDGAAVVVQLSVITVVERNVSVLTAALPVPGTLKVIVENEVMTEVVTLRPAPAELDPATVLLLPVDAARARQVVSERKHVFNRFETYCCS
jgi:hypothetical protein